MLNVILISLIPLFLTACFVDTLTINGASDTSPSLGQPNLIYPSSINLNTLSISIDADSDYTLFVKAMSEADCESSSDYRNIEFLKNYTEFTKNTTNSFWTKLSTAGGTTSECTKVTFEHDTIVPQKFLYSSLSNDSFSSTTNPAQNGYVQGEKGFSNTHQFQALIFSSPAAIVDITANDLLPVILPGSVSLVSDDNTANATSATQVSVSAKLSDRAGNSNTSYSPINTQKHNILFTDIANKSTGVGYLIDFLGNGSLASVGRCDSGTCIQTTKESFRLLGYDGISFSDFDNDGDVDYLTKGFPGDKVSVYTNAGDMTFSFFSLATFNSPNFYVGGFLNSDNISDFIVVDASGISILINNGSNTFSRTDITPSFIPGKPLVVDFDGDGDQDFIVTDNANENIILYTNDGTGVFSSNNLNTTTSPDPYEIMAVQLNPNVDSQLDIIYTETDGSIRALVSNGANFGDSVIETVDPPLDFVLFDFNGDNFTDIVATYNDRIILFSNDGGASFAKTTLFTGDAGDTIQLFDLNKDGIKDFVTNNTLSQYRYREFFNNGDGSISQASDRVNVPQNAVITDSSGIRSANLVGDSNEELIFISNLGIDIHRFEAANHIERVQFIENTSLSTSRYVIGDISGDGKPDIIVPDGSKISIYYNITESEYEKTDLSYTIGGISGIAIGDVDGNNTVDIVLVNQSNSLIRWYSNSGSLTFSESGDIGGFNDRAGVQVSDVDGDGDGDIIIQGDNDAPNILLNDGTQNFTTFSGAFTGVSGSSNILWTDLNGDNIPDGIQTFSGFGTPETFLFINTAPTTYTQVKIADSITTAHCALDLDGDGDLDLFGRSSSGNILYFWENTGPLTYSMTSWTSNSNPIPTDSEDLVCSDVDGDGFKELVVINLSGIQRVHLKK
ncbi:MAG: FG-GAP repeat domain-containing protein [Bdellovibrionales bacterium]